MNSRTTITLAALAVLVGVAVAAQVWTGVYPPGSDEARVLVVPGFG